MRYFYHVSWKADHDKKWRHSQKRFFSYEKAEQYLDSVPHDEGRIQIKKARQ